MEEAELCVCERGELRKLRTEKCPEIFRRFPCTAAERGHKHGAERAEEGAERDSAHGERLRVLGAGGAALLCALSLPSLCWKQLS